MELSGDKFEPSSSSRGHEKVEPGIDLLEEGWFFGNLLVDDRKAKMSRSYSDPCPNSLNFSHNQELSAEETREKDDLVPAKLIRTPSLPTSTPKREEEVRKPNKGLVRAPSLPPWIGREEVEEEDDDDHESEFTMGRLIRQASLSSSYMLPPRRTSKGLTQSSSMQRQRPRKKSELETSNMVGYKEMRQEDQIRQTKMAGKSPNDLELEEVQGFRDLGFKFEKEDLNHGVLNMLPGLQEKNRVELDDKNKPRRPYLSEAWHENSSAPTVPKWVEKRSAPDMKSQIKFWARAVASNVRQEC
ncbi:hypothetical protein RJ639_033378 [Escallonia herrerae]|uniref:Uncharacterized protein n=1 Tax=Escallonia herrerae TaxID=1293975 RepID=A0AA88XAN0_9ASTE|nr:hypothetical protein RJ639_039835 [Escallonia herrerae]KAK3035000.1 hypothetical protein RJ639_033378 [Escallonia herrerae]